MNKKHIDKTIKSLENDIYMVVSFIIIFIFIFTWVSIKDQEGISIIGKIIKFLLGG